MRSHTKPATALARLVAVLGVFFLASNALAIQWSTPSPKTTEEWIAADIEADRAVAEELEDLAQTIVEIRIEIAAIAAAFATLVVWMTKKTVPSSLGIGETVNINAADAKRLDLLPGIGPALAAAIIEYRTETPFDSIEQLMDVDGIGPSVFDGLKHLVIVNG